MKASQELLLRLSPDTVRKLAKLSEAHGISTAELVIHAVERQLPEWEAGKFIRNPVEAAANKPTECQPLPPAQP